MGVTSSLVTALSGLATSQQQIDVVGNNIANVNTIGYKSTSLDFKTQFLQNFSYGTAPTTSDGGTNPLQIGLGVQSGAMTTDFSDGTVQTTGVDTNMAIQGNGFFILKQGSSAQQVYTRDGTFQLNNQDQLVSSTGQLLQGFGVDSSYNIVPGVLTNLTVPLGAGSVAQATTTASFTGNLNANGTLPTSVAQLSSQALYLSNGAGGIDATNPPTASTPLIDVTDASGTAQFQVGDVLTFSGHTVGAVGMTPQTLTVTSNTKLSDLTSLMSGTIGIDKASGANGAVGTTPGVFATASQDPGNTNYANLTIAGNPGTTNDITLTANSLTITRGTNSLTPLTWTKTSTANGEAVTTQMTAYDSLGTGVPVNITAVLSSESSTGSTWQFYATSPTDPVTGAAINGLVGSGTLNFDSSGTLINTSSSTVNIDRTNTGATPSLSFALNFTGLQAQNGKDILQESSQDGAPPGTLKTFSIGNNGIISGSYSNGLSRTVGQVALATFQNDEGLVNDGSNTYSTGPNSGTAVITTPGELSAGTIVDNSLEGSNVDLSGEFVKLISASTAFSASSKVITTSEQLLQSLLQAAQ
jgi:flagellar hook protein FlgE